MTDQELEWIVADLQNAATEEQKERLKQWLEQDASHLEEYERIKALWSDSERVRHLSAVNEQQDWERIRAQIVPSRRPAWFTWAAAASIAILLSVAGLWYLQQNAGALEYATEVSMQEYTLSDGTQVFLNRNSRLLVSADFGEATREVMLEGEGFFEVVPDASRPFVVRSGESQTRVLGTAFNIREGEKVAIQVEHGKVAFGGSSNQLELTKNMAAVLQSNGQAALQEPDLNAFAWKTGVLRFQNDPLSKVFTDLEKQFDIQIKAETLPESLELTSTYNQQLPTAVLDEICLIYNLRYEVEGKTYTITNK